jgi:hypothetical protein
MKDVFLSWLIKPPAEPAEKAPSTTSSLAGQLSIRCPATVLEQLGPHRGLRLMTDRNDG